MSDVNLAEQQPATTLPAERSPTIWIWRGLAALGAALMALAVYLVPSAAYEIQAPFRAHGEQATGTVISKRIKERSYQGGGRRRGTRTYEEREVVVKLATESGRKITIDDLVLSSDYEALSEGSEVAVTFIRGQAARDALPKGPFYLLTSSVDAGTFSLIPWAFNGRPASGKAIAAALLGFVLLVFGGVMLLIRRGARQGGAAEYKP